MTDYLITFCCLRNILIVEHLQGGWRRAYQTILQRHGYVRVKIIRCVFIGPSGVGKSTLKRLLIDNKSTVVNISTGIMEAPEVVMVTSLPDKVFCQILCFNSSSFQHIHTYMYTNNAKQTYILRKIAEFLFLRYIHVLIQKFQIKINLLFQKYISLVYPYIK